MNELPKNLQTWLDALRSGEYKQGQSALHKVIGVEHYYCCAGVACRLAGLPHRSIKITDDISIIAYNGDVELLAKHINGSHQYNFDFWDSYFEWPDFSSYVDSYYDMNDNGKSFEQIADQIEADYLEWKRDNEATECGSGPEDE